jgi:type I restriction enzyme R subunit
LDRKKSVSLRKLLDKAAALTLTEDETATLAARLAKLELQLTLAERGELDGVAGQPMRAIVQDLVAAVDPDEQSRAMADAEKAAGPAGEPVDGPAIIQALIDKAIEPIAANTELRQRIVELRASHDQVIDDLTIDVLLDAHAVVDAGAAKSVVESWSQYLLEHRDEIAALQVLYAGPKGRRPTFAELRELADRIKRPPYNWTPDVIWRAYEKVEVGRVKHADRTQVTDLVSLVRFAVGADGELVPYADKVRERYQAWLHQQEQAGASFTDRQRWWLDRIADVIAASAGITPDDLDNAPFTERGGTDGALADLGDDAADYLETLNSDDCAPDPWALAIGRRWRLR